MTARNIYHFIVTAQPEQDAVAAYQARGAHDSWQINQEATVTRAKINKQVVWIVRLFKGSKPTVYVTQQQASALGLCHCGKVAQYIGFEGIRCNVHAKGGMSLLCSTEGCTNVSHTGFSSWCNACITPAQREGYGAYQAERRKLAQRPYRY